jgi:hypothetical protein
LLIVFFSWYRGLAADFVEERCKGVLRVCHRIDQACGKRGLSGVALRFSGQRGLHRYAAGSGNGLCLYMSLGFELRLVIVFNRVWLFLIVF